MCTRKAFAVDLHRYPISELALPARFQQSARALLVFLPMCAFAIIEQFGSRRVPPPSLEGLKGRPPPCPSLPTDRAPIRHCRSGRGTVSSAIEFGAAGTVKPLLPNSLERAGPVRRVSLPPKENRDAAQTTPPPPPPRLPIVRRAMRSRRTISWFSPA